MTKLIDEILDRLESARNPRLIVMGSASIGAEELLQLNRDFQPYLDSWPDVTAVICQNPLIRLVWYFLLTVNNKPFVLISERDGCERIQEQILTSKASRIVSDFDLSTIVDVTYPPGPVFPVGGATYADIQSNILAEVPPETMYGIFTSGSTGRPRCIFHTHDDVSATIAAYREDVKLNPGSKLGMFASPHHDAAIVDLYYALMTGCSLVIAESNNVLAILRSLAVFQREGVEVWHCVPSVLKLVLNLSGREKPIPWPQIVVLGGESASATLIDQLWLHSPQTRPFILYGQSECSYISGRYVQRACEANQFPTSSTGLRTRIINKGDGTGELMVRTSRYAHGYSDSAGTVSLVDTDAWHSTGDLVRESHGLYEFIGRADDVVNIAGNRVNPQEIERRLLSLLKCDYAVVGAVERGGRTYLMASVYRACKQPGVADVNLLLSPFLQDGIGLKDIIYHQNEPTFLSTHKVNRFEVIESMKHL